MVIVIVVDCFVNKSNGTAVSANNLASALRDLGHCVRVVAPFVSKDSSRNGDNVNQNKDSSDKCYYEVAERYIPLVSEVSHTQNMHFGKADKEVLREAFVGADLVHLFLPFKLEIVALKLAKELKIPCLGAFHLQPEHITYNIKLGKFEILNKALFWWWKERYYKHFSHIHCPSKLIADELKAHNYNAKLAIISNGFNASFKVQRKPSSDGFFHIVMTGRYSREKRQDVLIDAIALSKYEKQIKLHLKGLGPKEKSYKERAKKLSNEVDFGFVSKDELAKLYETMDIYVHCADIDGEAISALEAMAAGITPIIADSKLSATKQFALDSRSLFKSGNAKDLSQKIDYFIENKNELKALGEQYKDSTKQYDLNLCVNKMIETYKEVIKAQKQ